MLFGQGGSVFERGQDILARQRGVGLQKIVDRVAGCQHPNNLVYGNAGALDAGLTVAYGGID